MFAPFNWLVWLAFMSHVSDSCSSSNKHPNNNTSDNANKSNGSNNDPKMSTVTLATSASSTTTSSSTVMEGSQLQSVISVQTRSNLQSSSTLIGDPDRNVSKAKYFSAISPGGSASKQVVRHRISCFKTAISVIPDRNSQSTTFNSKRSPNNNNNIVYFKGPESKSKSKSKSKQLFKCKKSIPKIVPKAQPPPVPVPAAPLALSDTVLQDVSQASSVFSRDFSALNSTSAEKNGCNVQERSSKQQVGKLETSEKKSLNNQNKAKDGDLNKETIVKDDSFTRHSSEKSMISKSLFRVSCSESLMPKQEQKPEEEKPMLPEKEKPMLPEKEKPMLLEEEKPMLSEKEKPMLPEEEKPMLPEEEKPMLPEKKQTRLEQDHCIPQEEIVDEKPYSPEPENTGTSESSKLSPEKETSAVSFSPKMTSSLSQSVPKDETTSSSSNITRNSNSSTTPSQAAVPKNLFNLNYLNMLKTNRLDCLKKVTGFGSISFYTTSHPLNKKSTAAVTSSVPIIDSCFEVTVTQREYSEKSNRPIRRTVGGIGVTSKFDSEKCVREPSISERTHPTKRSNIKSNDTVKSNPIQEYSSKSSADSSSINRSILVKLDGEVLKVPRVVHSMGYEFLKKIGSGGFASVYKAKNRQHFPGRVFACKLFDLRQINTVWIRKHLRTEMKIMQDVCHANVMRADKVIKTKNHAFIFMAFAENGNILNHMYYRVRRPLKEKLARSWFRSLLHGVEYLHNKNIVHRDLKLENFLLNRDFVPIITDFGFSNIIQTSTSMRDKINRALFSSTYFVPLWADSICGTPEYVAPEVHQLQDGQKYDARAVDAYAMGVCLFEMVNLNKPFMGGPFSIRNATLVKLQLNCQYSYNKRVTLSSECRRTIQNLLEPNPRSRSGIGTVLRCPWMSKPESKPLLSFFSRS